MSLPLLVGGILYMLRFMPAPDTHWAVKLDVGLAWYAMVDTRIQHLNRKALHAALHARA